MKKLSEILHRLYGFFMSLAFWGGLLPLIPFVLAILLGGSTGESIALFLSEKYYPVVIVLASMAILLGLAGLYTGDPKSRASETDAE